MNLPRPVCVDFESDAIEQRPAYPPKPCGVAIQYPGEAPRYYAWGHASANSCTFAQASKALAKAWRYARTHGLLCQNAKFDVDEAETFFGLAPLPWDKVEDTMYLLFLDDPHQPKLALKPAAERLLNMPPEEKDEVCDWLLAHQPVPGVKISKSESSPTYFMKYLPYAPGDLVGRYACGDTNRTVKLFELLYPRTVARGMLDAYNRERRLMPILLEAERRGLPVDLAQLRADVASYTDWRARLDAWCLKRLRAGPELNLDSGAQLVEAMVTAGVCDPDKMPKTATGKVSTAKESLLLGVTDLQLLATLTYRTQLGTCLHTFMEPWLQTAETSQGLIFTSWNQVRGTGGGTRSGRLSSTPNFQNIPLTFKPGFKHEVTALEQRKLKLPAAPFKGLPKLPQVRRYVLPFPHDLLLGRDFSSQELRILAHFENGPMMAAYQANPRLDLHQFAADLITKTTGIPITRKDAKTIGFSILYGSGLTKLALGLGCAYDEAKRLKAAYLGALPGVKALIADLNRRAAVNEPIHTIGGREYYVEPPKIVDGKIRTFAYKMLNYLVQPSAADQTKDAMIAFHAAGTPGKLLASVHDELLVSAPKTSWRETMAVLRECMHASGGLDVPVVSDGEVGESWTTMKECE